jgi:hypothetical protein
MQKKGNICMNNTVRTWKERIYQQNSSAEEQATPLARFTGDAELADEELAAIYRANDNTQTPNYIYKPFTNANNTPLIFLYTTFY